jgi:SNF2 family DNA or RNA helicase
MTKFIVKKYIEFCNQNNIRVQNYQIYGVLWCIRKEREQERERVLELMKKKGGILADDMGMGKTIQMIMTLFLNFKKKTLILLPPILIQQWYSEIWKILGHSSFLYYKKNKDMVELENPNVNIVITSYDTFLRSPELLHISWNRVICDEAHHLRNPKTKIYTKVHMLKTDILWFLTGTPIHNKIKDITALITLFLDYTATAIEKKKIQNQPLEEYKSMFLRRMKINSHILLPKKMEIEEMISWTDSRELELAKDIHLSIIPGTSSTFWDTTQTCKLVTMIRAKQLCILSKLLEKPIQKLEDEDEDDDEKKGEEEIDNGLNIQKCKQIITNQSTSCKLTAILSCIYSRMNNGQGKIIFCHFQLEMTKIIEILRECPNNHNCWIGNWKEFEKNKKKEGLGNKTPILILQIRAGCEGLNLQDDFSEVYFVSPNWNPTLEEQAIARCHRIGQQKEVSVFRFYMDSLEKEKEKIHSMDQYILHTQNKKREKITEFMNKITIV